jgi:predicted enzyme related to lactoylglutathione lyase
MNNDCLKHGAFGWFELMTTDVESAKAFYEDLLGWETETAPMEGFDYTIIKIAGDTVGGMMVMPPECEGLPPSWDIYITVKDVDAIAGRVPELGGKILRPPADIPGVGRFCIIQDPQGAVIAAMTYVKA